MTVLPSDPSVRRTALWLKVGLPVLVVLLAAGVAGFFYFKRVAQPDTTQAKVTTAVTLELAADDVVQVVLHPLARQIALSGSLRPLTQATVKSRVSGQVQTVGVREGQAVRQGELLAELDTTDARLRLDAALADQSERRARLAIAARNRDTNQALLQQNFISANAFDQLQSTYQAALAAVQWADAQVKLARQSKVDAAVHAPISGVVAQRMVNPGDRVVPDSPMLQLVDLSRLELQATVPASDLASIAVGQAVGFGVDGFGERRFEGRVERINPLTEPGSRAIKLFVSVPNADASLRGGMFAQGAVTVAQAAPAPVVPLSAVFEEAGQSYVFAIAEGKLVKQPVQLGVQDASSGRVEVRQGLAADSVVVRVRMPGLKAGAPVVMATLPNRPALPASAPVSS